MQPASPELLKRQIHRHFEELQAETRIELLSNLQEKVCSNCGEMEFVTDKETSEVCCTTCGLVQNNGEDMCFKPTFGQGKHSSPTSHLSFNHSLGDTLSRNDLFRVLAKTTEPGLKFDDKTHQLVVDKDLTVEMREDVKNYLRQNIGLRARFIRILNCSTDPPWVKKALGIGEELCREFGIVGEDAVIFRDYYGRLLKKVANLAVLMKNDGETFECRRLSRTTFVFAWQLMEMQHGLRKNLHYQQTFPSWGTRYRRGLKRVKLHRYRIRKEDWDFVWRAYRVQVPAVLLRKH